MAQGNYDDVFVDGKRLPWVASTLTLIRLTLRLIEAFTMLPRPGGSQVRL